MAFAKAAPDSLQVVFVVVFEALGWPIVEQLRETHPSVGLVEQLYCCQKPIRNMVIMKRRVTSSCSAPL
eukprot:7390501-Pyramimonas_sp.AAC.1